MSSMQLLPYKQQVSSLLRLGLPIVVGQLGMIILGLADTIIMGIIVRRSWLRLRS